MTSDLGTVHTTRSLTTIEHLHTRIRELEHELAVATEDKLRAEASVRTLQYLIMRMRRIEPYWDMAVGDVAQLNGD